MNGTKGESSLRLIRASRKEKDDFSSAARKVDIKSLIDRVPTWSALYEVPYGILIGIVVHLFNEKDAIDNARDIEELEKAVSRGMKRFDSFLSEIEHDEDCDTWVNLLLPLCVALHMNNVAIEERNRTINDMLSDVRLDSNKGLDSLFEAITVDPTVLATNTANKVVSIAHLQDDNSFKDRLAKAITRTKPAKVKVEYNDARIMLHIAESLKGDEPISLIEADELLSGLGIYPEGEDTLQSIKKFLTKRKKDMGK